MRRRSDDWPEEIEATDGVRKQASSLAQSGIIEILDLKRRILITASYDIILNKIMRPR